LLKNKIANRFGNNLSKLNVNVTRNKANVNLYLPFRHWYQYMGYGI